MGKNITRKCKACSQQISINRNDVRNVVFYKNCYYHSDCFCDLAAQRVQSSRGKKEEWKAALNNLSQLEKDAKDILSARIPIQSAKNDLNDYLLSQYNVTAIDNSRFWQVVSDLSNGFYKQKRCKKVPTDVLLAAWKWGQHNLNEINKQNKMNHRGPATDNERLLYDLAIIVNKVPNYLAHKAKCEAEMEAMKEKQRNSTRIDYDSLERTEVNKEGLGDISALLDEF